MSATVDLRHAGRALRRRPVYAATVIATIAVGIAACVATFCPPGAPPESIP